MSNHPLRLVLMYNTVTDQAFWYTPSDANRLLESDPCFEEIPEFAANYEAVAKLAGDKPERIVKENQ